MQQVILCNRFMPCIFFLMCRGTSQDNKMAAFRECYSKLYELRSLAPNVPMVALTATATKLTRDTILSLLNMANVVEITESPNKLNVAYVIYICLYIWIRTRNLNFISAGLLMN